MISPSGGALVQRNDDLLQIVPEGRDFHQPWHNSGDLTREQNMGYHEDNTWDNGCLSMTKWDNYG